MSEIRNKLIELIAKAKRSMWGEKGMSCELARNGFVAEYLLANGVTFAEDKWIPASDPPKNSGNYIVMIQGARKATTLVYTIQHKKWVDEVMDEYRVTYWMPFPQPPKEDE